MRMIDHSFGVLKERVQIAKSR